MLLRLLAPAFLVRSAVDVGAGVGTWLAVLAHLGVEDLLGVEGRWALESEPLVDRSHYRVMDLSRPEPVGRRFDLALCLEVAEHITPVAAEGFIALLTQLRDVILSLPRSLVESLAFCFGRGPSAGRRRPVR